MKKVLIMLMSIALIFALTACGSSDQPKDAGTEKAEKAQETENALVKPLDSAIITNEDGKKVLLVSYTFTNTKEETTNAMAAVYNQAFQDGVGLEPAAVLPDELPEKFASLSENEWKNLKPKASIDCLSSFVLTSNSDVEVEFGEFLGKTFYKKTYKVE